MEAPGLFAGLTFVTLGRLPGTVEEAVKRQGGKVVKALSKKVTHALTSDAALQCSLGTAKFSKVRELDVPIVDIRWITECCSANARQSPTPFLIKDPPVPGVAVVAKSESADQPRPPTPPRLTDRIFVPGTGTGTMEERRAIRKAGLVTTTNTAGVTTTTGATGRVSMAELQAKLTELDQAVRRPKEPRRLSSLMDAEPLVFSKRSGSGTVPCPPEPVATRRSPKTARGPLVVAAPRLSDSVAREPSPVPVARRSPADFALPATPAIPPEEKESEEFEDKTLPVMLRPAWAMRKVTSRVAEPRKRPLPDADADAPEKKQPRRDEPIPPAPPVPEPAAGRSAFRREVTEWHGAGRVAAPARATADRTAPGPVPAVRRTIPARPPAAAVPSHLRHTASSRRQSLGDGGVSAAARDRLNRSGVGMGGGGATAVRSTASTAATATGASARGGAAAQQRGKEREREREKDKDKDKDEEENELMQRVRRSPFVKGQIDEAIWKHIMREIVDLTKSVGWADISGLENAKNILWESIILPSKRPDLFRHLRKPAKGLLLFGPPGNGKTLLAKAVASQCDATFFNISASSLTSKWVGEGEKFVRALFACARACQPSVVFIDEVDSLLTTRSSNEHEASRRLKTEFLVQMDGVGSDEEDRVLILGATNRPQELDDAVIRRFTKRVYIPLPDGLARRKMAEILFRDLKYSFSDVDWDYFVQKTDGYSGCDLANLVKDMAFQPIRELGVRAMDIDEADIRPVGIDDFKASMNNIRSSVSSDVLSTMLRWNAQYGSLA